MKNNKDKVMGALKRIGKGTLGVMGDMVAPNLAVKRQLSDTERMMSDKKYNQIMEDRMSRKNFMTMKK